MKIWGFVLLVSLCGGAAQASMDRGGFHVGLSALRYDDTTKGDSFGGNEYKNTNMFLDVKVGYQMENKIYLGVLYSSYSQSTNTETPSRTATGLSAGYHSEGLYADLSYFLTSEYKYSSGSTFKDGSGFGFDFGYNMPLSSAFYLGLQMSYRSYSYKKINETTANNSFTTLQPMFNLGFYF